MLSSPFRPSSTILIFSSAEYCLRVARRGAPDAGGEMSTETIDPEPDRFPAYDSTPLRKQIFDVRGAKVEAVIGPDSVWDDLTREAKAFQTGHASHFAHRPPLSQK